MGIAVYNEWQKERLPLGPSFVVDAADLHRRQSRRLTPRVKASARSSYSSSTQFAHPRYGAEDFFLWPPEVRGSRRQSPTGARTSSATWLRLRCYISAVLKQDRSLSLMEYTRCSRPCLALHSTSAAPIMGEVRYNSLMKTFPQEAEELFVATERNAKLRYEGYKKLSEM